ncbi:peptidoglycan-associated lipoprotein [Candidatus Photodesmus blepharus]|uniref:Peptidoglycan-associated lipoprotein n=2 Tax=Candidatus Photodesmus blepharonis TaxID=1179155 RepID=A0A084CPM3_9GAMM|nr:peptidoglycan-associated lipoprotein [Candidatus Photodesmus blepharus]
MHVALIVLILTCFGCANFTKNIGTGELVKNYISATFSPVMPHEPLGPEHGLRFDWQITKLHLDSLVQEGAKWCFPAAVTQAIEKQNRIARELEAGLLLDAANDLLIQRKRLNELDIQMNYVTSEIRCTPPPNQSEFHQHLEIIDQLFHMLNIDNQFAHNSIEINPKYIGQLAQAVNLLRIHKNLELSITGHSDSTGDEKNNHKLAMARANQVKRYLIIFGLEPLRITTKSVGETLPLFEGDSPGVHLTNRRVSIEILSMKKSNTSLFPRGIYERE